ncbi:hypothetical protein [Streptomyces calidiresistens]|uniref:Uncharacterized protein n=1 Tax=Streptomyces calidiresistens TaxID=1485586 RepID=A0A7W3T648_9ACTN|nr:hypothetical protein [Streptomyces calidiresistens]MBB0231493.1 hypothetical protein [Streptomyces calidiresistens]
MSATPIYDALCAEYRRLFRTLPGDRSGEEESFDAFASRLSSRGGVVRIAEAFGRHQVRGEGSGGRVVGGPTSRTTGSTGHGMSMSPRRPSDT